MVCKQEAIAMESPRVRELMAAVLRSVADLILEDRHPLQCEACGLCRCDGKQDLDYMTLRSGRRVFKTWT